MRVLIASSRTSPSSHCQLVGRQTVAFTIPGGKRILSGIHVDFSRLDRSGQFDVVVIPLLLLEGHRGIRSGRRASFSPVLVHIRASLVRR